MGCDGTGEEDEVKHEKCPSCGEYLIYTDGHGFYRTLNYFTLKEQARVYQCSHRCGEQAEWEATLATRETQLHNEKDKP